MISELSQFAAATNAESQLSQRSSQELAKLLARKRIAPVEVHFTSDSDESIPIPLSALRLLNEILNHMAEGNAVTVNAVRAELTTQQAADLLGVSRPFLVEQLDSGAIPHRKVGTHRRVLLKDLLVYQAQMNRKRADSLAELSALDQELGLG